MRSFVFDSLPLLRFFRRQPGWEYIDTLLEEGIATSTRHLMSAINWGEVYYILLQTEGPKVARGVERRIQRSAIEIILPTLDQVRLAAEMKAKGGISYADCFAGALALERELPVLTADPEFKRLIDFGVKVEWLQ
jgi:predicted nucleic acid-binding protein